MLSEEKAQEFSRLLDPPGGRVLSPDGEVAYRRFRRGVLFWVILWGLLNIVLIWCAWPKRLRCVDVDTRQEVECPRGAVVR